MLRSILIGAAAIALIVGAASAQHAPKTYKAGALVIEAPWARATPAGAKVAGGYLKITNTGREPDRLIGGSLPVAAAVEIHEMKVADGIMKMRRLDKGLEIKPGQTVELKPGGYHIMFTGLSEGLKDKQTIKGTLVFETAGSVEVEYRVAPIGAKSGGHMGH
jgi:copper(I)-binding protein